MNILFTAVSSIFVFGLVIFIHEFGHFITAKISGIKVNEFALGMGPVLLRFTKGETIYALRAFPIGGFVSMEGENGDSEDARSFTSAPVKKRLLVLVAGVAMNLLLGFAVLLILVSQQTAITSKTVSSFAENASTYQSGLRVGDEILSVNGRRCFIADDVVYEFARTQNGTASLTVLRDGVKTQLPNVIFSTRQAEDGTRQMIIDFTVLPIEKTAFTVTREAGAWTVSLARLIFLTLVDLVTGNVPVNDLSGPVGIVAVIGQAAALGYQSVLMILALITINLGIFNLLPFPALDGGRIAFLLVEAVRRKPLNPKYEALVNSAGFIALMLLMLFVTFNDVTKLIFK